MARDDDDNSKLAVYLSFGRLRTAPADAWPADSGTVADPLLPELSLGVWRHRKGEDYLVLGVAADDRGGEPRVIYVRLYSREGLPVSARRFSVFTDADEEGPRFRFLGQSQPAIS